MSESLWEESSAKGMSHMCFEKAFLMLQSLGGHGAAMALDAASDV